MSCSVALFAGDVSLDLTLHIAHVPQPDEKVHVGAASESAGGVVANAAVACARTGVATRVLLRAGADAVGGRVLAELAERGVDVTASSRDGETCRVVVLLEPHGEKRLLLYPGTSMYPTLAQVQALSLADVAWMHTATYDIAASAALIARSRAAAIPWSVDLEPATFTAGIAALEPHLHGAAVVFCNARAAAALGEDAASVLFAMGAHAVVLTEGRAGATWCEGDERWHLAAPAIVPVDTTGAGDCLAGWLVAGLVAGVPKHRALADAVLAASISCLRPGAQLSYPTPGDLSRFSETRVPVAATKQE
jgi:ribokinase